MVGIAEDMICIAISSGLPVIRYEHCARQAPPPRIGKDASRNLVMTRFRSDNRAMIPTSISPMLSVRRGAAAVEFYKSALAAEVVYRIDAPDGTVVARLSINGTEFWVADGSSEHKNFRPETLGGGTGRMVMVVDD